MALPAEEKQSAPPSGPKRDYVIVFGASVRPDGRPSATLRQRIDGALRWAAAHPDSMILPTGGVGEAGVAEANVVARSLAAAGIAPERIIPEVCARDTLESVCLCDALLRARGDCRRVICCTSRFHQPRCALLLRLLGYEVVVPPMPKGPGPVSPARHARYVLKEIAATPYDAVLLLARRLFTK
jgi:uncharacterized SAM-binding protein YcdF (DUF218 family)